MGLGIPHNGRRVRPVQVKFAFEHDLGLAQLEVVAGLVETPGHGLVELLLADVQTFFEIFHLEIEQPQEEEPHRHSNEPDC